MTKRRYPTTTTQALEDALAQERAAAAEKAEQLEPLTHQPFTYFITWGLIVLHIVLFLVTIRSATAPAVPVQDELTIPQPAWETTHIAPVQPIRDNRILEIAQLSRSQLKDTLPPLNAHLIRLRGVEVTQGIQVFNEPENARCMPNPNHPDYIFCNNSIPLVAGRHTMVRLYLSCADSCPTTEASIILKLRKDGLNRATFNRPITPEMMSHVNSMSLMSLRSHLHNSINFDFRPPPEWFTGPLTFEFEILTAQGQTIPLHSLTVNFEPRKALRIAYLPIQYQGATPQKFANESHWLQRMFPTAEVDYYRLPVPDLVWEGDLNKAEILKRLLYTYWLYASHHPAESWPDQLFGWLPQEYYNGGASDPYWCPNCAGPNSSRVAFGGVRPELDIGGARILVHEIAHNLGAQHAWSPTQRQDTACFRGEGVDIQVDPGWPYSETPYIQEVGIDLYSESPVVYPPYFYDMMAYCTQPWISPHTYRTLFDSPFLQPSDTVALPSTEKQPHVETSYNGALLVSGVVYRDGTVDQPEIIQLEGQAVAGLAAGFSPPSNGDYCITVTDAGQQSLGKKCFDIGFVNLETGLPNEEASPFFVTMPNINLEQATRVTLSKNETVLTHLDASNSPPEVTLTYPNGGETVSGQQEIRWTAHDPDGDALTFDLLYSPDAGQSWLPLAVRLGKSSFSFHTGDLTPGENSLIRVIVSDGFHTNTDSSDAPFNLNPLLENSLHLAGPVSVEAGQTFQLQLRAHQLTAPGLADLSMQLDFEAAHLHMETVQFATSVTGQTDINNTTGQLTLTATAAPALHGDVVLATITLRAHTPTERSTLRFNHVELLTSEGRPHPLNELWELTLQVVE